MRPDTRGTLRDTPRWHRLPGGVPTVASVVVTVLAVLFEFLLLARLLSPGTGVRALAWCIGHAAVAAVAAGVTTSAWLPGPDAVSRRRLCVLCLGLNLALPLAGVLGTNLALVRGIRIARRRRHGEDYWRVTPHPTLPFTTPANRTRAALDGRGLSEQLMFDANGSGLYRKVLAAGRMSSARSVDALRAGVRHADERIRLTAYQTLDRKSSALNDEIDRLRARAAEQQGRERADTWLQVASNYWELLTLEQNEPVARAQLLQRADEAALEAIIAWPSSRNAHYTLARIALRRGDSARAEVGLARAQALGMPASTTLPYRAEAAFLERDFPRVKRLLAGIDTAFTDYPPLRAVAAHWR